MCRHNRVLLIAATLVLLGCPAPKSPPLTTTGLPAPVASAPVGVVLAGQVVAPVGGPGGRLASSLVGNAGNTLIGNAGNTLVGNAGNTLIGMDGGSVTRSTNAGGGLRTGAAGNLLRLLAAADGPLANTEVFLADGGGNPLPGLPPARTDAEGRFRFEAVPPGFTYLVAARIKDERGNSGTLRTIVRPDALGATVDISGASTLVCASLTSGSGQALGRFEPAAFAAAVQLTERHLGKGGMPEWTSLVAVTNFMSQLMTEVAELRTSVESMKRDLADIKETLEEVKSAIAELRPPTTATPTPPAARPTPSIGPGQSPLPPGAGRLVGGEYRLRFEPPQVTLLPEMAIEKTATLTLTVQDDVVKASGPIDGTDRRDFVTGEGKTSSNAVRLLLNGGSLALAGTIDPHGDVRGAVESQPGVSFVLERLPVAAAPQALGGGARWVEAAGTAPGPLDTLPCAKSHGVWQFFDPDGDGRAMLLAIGDYQAASAPRYGQVDQAVGGFDVGRDRKLTFKTAQGQLFNFEYDPAAERLTGWRVNADASTTPIMLVRSTDKAWPATCEVPRATRWVPVTFEIDKPPYPIRNHEDGMYELVVQGPPSQPLVIELPAADQLALEVRAAYHEAKAGQADPWLQVTVDDKIVKTPPLNKAATYTLAKDPSAPKAWMWEGGNLWTVFYANEYRSIETAEAGVGQVIASPPGEAMRYVWDVSKLRTPGNPTMQVKLSRIANSHLSWVYYVRILKRE